MWSPVFICDALVDDTILATFLSKLSEISPMWLLGISTLKGFFTVKSYYIKLLSNSTSTMESRFLGKFGSLEDVSFCVGSFAWEYFDM